jgi:hypothetical protein
LTQPGDVWGSETQEGVVLDDAKVSVPLPLAFFAVGWFAYVL